MSLLVLVLLVVVGVPAIIGLAALVWWSSGRSAGVDRRAAASGVNDDQLRALKSYLPTVEPGGPP